MRALAHPIRLQILSLLTGSELSAADIARELGITQPNASYHLRTLLAAGRVVEVGTRTVRGGVAKLYRHPWESTDAPPTAREDVPLFIAALASELLRRFDLVDPTSPATDTDAELWVSPATWAQVVDRVNAASRVLHSRAKPPRTPGTVHVNMSAALFQMQDPPR